MTSDPSSLLQGALQDVLARIASTDASPADLALLHREAVYAALDLGDTAVAMTHALSCLNLARAVGDAPLRVKAHVALALVQAEAFDDLGAETQFAQADGLARTAGDHRGVVLVAVNASHYEMERGQYLAAVTRLQTLFGGSHLDGLDTALMEALHINYVVSATRVCRQGLALPPQMEAQLSVSLALLEAWNADRPQLTQPLRTLELLEGLTTAALMHGQVDRAAQLADERVLLARQMGGALLHGRALLDRARVYEAWGAWTTVEADARQAIALFEEARHDLFATSTRELLAEAYAHLDQHEQAYKVQKEATRRVQSLYREFYQQRALLGQIEQQARDAEVRASAFAEAALRDHLTGAPNRAHAMQVLAALHAQAQQGRTSTVALLDLDHFKRINDSYGHAAGDAVLTRVAQTLSAGIRDVDCVARFGGEEFVVILTGVPLDAGRRACERLGQTLAELEWPGISPELRVTASFGVAALGVQEDLKATLHSADQALYAAKAAGRNTVRVATPQACHAG
ncbi:GGDEF domain-containing protein (plasmid) [Deinococcus taeanensis]|uniref:GGDEF domain-containing protein n=1 Tax=Deinococcus taeanensis TaxID=2737050 RepID=UPI001CDD8D60|nr:GGDEF domain-containing protein [Deinococcus taeanensis]UBV45311.1 GGDEF domain-containing protein [Deinococcus taeanensis]